MQKKCFDGISLHVLRLATYRFDSHSKTSKSLTRKDLVMAKVINDVVKYSVTASGYHGAKRQQINVTISHVNVETEVSQNKPIFRFTCLRISVHVPRTLQMFVTEVLPKPHQREKRIRCVGNGPKNNESKRHV